MDGILLPNKSQLSIMLRLILRKGANLPRIIGACVGKEFPIAVKSSGKVRLFLDARDLAPEVERSRIGICDCVGDSLSRGGAVIFVVILLLTCIFSWGLLFLQQIFALPLLPLIYPVLPLPPRFWQ